MIVDDSNIMRNKISKLGDGILDNIKVVAKAENGEDAIAQFKKWQPDIVTMDLTMPKVDGLECIQALVELNPEVRILVVSALSDKATGIKALKYGARGFVCKPFTDEELAKALQRIMNV